MFAVTRDNTRIGYSIVGNEDSARRVALVHSLAMDREFWRPVAERLSGEAACLIVDCRGHGKSDRPTGPYTPELFADDLADVMTHVGWDSAVVAGASMGGTVSIAFGVNHAARTRGLGLFDTTAWYGADAPKAWAERADKAGTDGLGGLVDFQKTRWFSDAFRARHADVVDACIDVFLRNDVPAYQATCRMLGNADLRGKLSAIKAPARIAVGEEDYATPVAMSQALHDALPGSTLRVIKGGRHLTPLETPDVIADELRALLKA